ncbi:MAG: Gfo/Idh/MocA family oxidoreductase [Muribaculaceae bacterium]|nr:Gfo/Idh/MocA family oxidoreductase [Muribaculaceae bacterium]
MDNVRFGVVGTNFITDWLIEGARQDPRFELSAVYSRTRERAEEFASRHDIPHLFTSLEEMAASDLIDAVYIASPNFMHAAQSLLCMRHGKHVLCEKPLASNAVEARAMIEASERYGVTLMEAMKPTMTPHFLSLKDNLSRVGTVRRYFASYCQYSSRYDRFKAGELPNAFNPELSNGAIMDIGVYTVYPMVVLFGRPDKVSVSGVLLSSGVDGQGAVTFDYPGGMQATVLYSKIADSRLRSEIQGEAGLISLDTINRMADITFTPRVANLGGGKSEASVTENISATALKNEYYYEVAEFISLVLDGRRESAINSHAASLTTMELLDEIRRQIGVVFPADLSPRLEL